MYLPYNFSSGSWSEASDQRLKKNIENYEESGLDLINKIKVRKFHFNKDDDKSSKKVGVIAQEIQQVLPHLVSENENKNGKYLGVAYGGMPIYAVKAIQELSKTVEWLTKQNEELVQRILILENKNKN